ncbi:cbb3-type cytochrome c oxidase N-terminal domain-containing protein [Pedobacter sp. PWIIR3]
MTDLFIGILLAIAIILLAVSLLILKVIKVYANEVLHPTPFATEAEKELLRLALEQAKASLPAKPSILEKIMGLKPISDEKELIMEHTFDGIAELDNPTPAWFMVLFYGTITFAIVYLLSYHVFGWAPLQDEEYAIELRQAEEAKTAMLLKPGNAANKINENNVEIIKDASELKTAGILFKSTCAPCHGENAQGIVGPNLTDAYWLHGGTVKEIFKTIKYGVPDKGMIAWEKTIRPKQIAELASYILTLQGSNPPGAKAPQGNKL